MNLKKLSILFAVLQIFTALAFSQEKVYKQFSINGETVNRWVTLSSFEEYDENENLIHIKHYDYKAESWYEYNSDGKVIHTKKNGDYQSWYKYDSQGRAVSFKDTYGTVRTDKYTSKGRIAYYKNKYKDAVIEYNLDGKIIHANDKKNKYEEWYYYDEKGNLIRKVDSDNGEIRYEYDSAGNEIYRVEYNDAEIWHEYDENGNCIHFKSSNGYEDWSEYNSDGKLIYQKTNKGEITTYDYDEAGRQIHYKMSKEKKVEDVYYEFEFYPNGKIKTRTCYKTNQDN